MKNILQYLYSYCFILSLCTVTAQAAVHWETDFEKAQKLADESGKVMLLDFTGSDWCGWCIRLKDEVFSQKSFQSYAEENLVLVQIDFPRKKGQSKQLKDQNRTLKAKYGIRGFPTVILLSSKGDYMQQTGYKAGGPEAYVAHLKELIAKSQ